MPDINWGGDATTAPYSSRYDEASGNLILAEDNDGNTVLLEWDGATWQYRGPVEMNGEDVSGVGTLTATDVVADSVNTEQATVGAGSQITQIEVGSTGNLQYPTAAADATWDTSENTEHTITFDTAFDSTPRVLVHTENKTNGVIGEVDDVTTTDFVLRIDNYSTDDRSSLNRAFSYIAFEV